MPKHRKVELHRYNLGIPESRFEEIQELIVEDDMTILEFIRQALKVFIFIKRAQKNGVTILVRDGEKETELVVL